jgi:hypothetical protein
MANQSFGGLLMQWACKLAYSTAYIFAGERPIFYEVDQAQWCRHCGLEKYKGLLSPWVRKIQSFVVLCVGQDLEESPGRSSLKKSFVTLVCVWYYTISLLAKEKMV